ncbi:MAG: beta galactosidase jelly roll domain-containing protein, partial [Bacteroidota bacterium]|nr:beta galactosidase jelly roll domain-containing protein [Bacteroidota bacterium]
MKKIRGFFLLMLTVICFNARSQDRIREKINFDNDWKFHLGNASDPSKDFNYSIGNIFSKTGKGDGTAVDVKFHDSAWRSLALPHDWAVELPFVNSPNHDVMAHGYKPVGGLFPETGIGWYRKHFSIDRKDSGQHFQIQFDGIFRDANVWINNIYLGNNKSGYIGFAYDITDFINYDKENVLVVRVDAMQYEGWFYEGAGIYRHVWLNQFNNMHIANDGVFVSADVQKNNASINIETSIENQNLFSSTCAVSSVVTDREGKILGQTKEQPVALDINETKIIKQKILLNNPKLWSVDDPYLYRIITTIKFNGKIIDTDKKRFGIRTINVTKDGLFVNGKYLKIQGVCDHQDHAGVGSALPDYLQYYRIQLLKEMGANAYRTTHNPPTPELLDACDSLGMLVLDETRLLNSSHEYMNQFEQMLLRDRSHPSIFMWSIGNEEGYVQTNSTGKRIAQSLLAKQKGLDHTRTSTYASDLGNVYRGVNEVIPVRGFNYRVPGVDPYHKD